MEEVCKLRRCGRYRLQQRREARGERATGKCVGFGTARATGQVDSSSTRHLARRNTVAGAGGAARTGWRLERVCAGTSAKRLPSRVYKQHDLPSLTSTERAKRDEGEGRVREVAAPVGPAHADATTSSHTFTHCQELKFRGIVGCRLHGRRLVGRRLVGRFLGTEGNQQQGFQRFHVFETDAIPCAVHSTQLTRQASHRQGGAGHPAKGTRRRTRAPPSCKRELALHRARRTQPPAVIPRHTPPLPSHR